jgi:hypothetical protein
MLEAIGRTDSADEPSARNGSAPLGVAARSKNSFALRYREAREGRKNLKLLLAANKRLDTAYLLRESFAQLWDYKSQAWARRFFDNWKSQLRWRRLKPSLEQ